MKLKMYLMFAISSLHFAVASPAQHEYQGASRRPQAAAPAEVSGPSRAPAIISAPLVTDSFEKQGFYYFSFKLNGRTRAYKVASSSITDGIYLFGRDVDSSPLLVSVFSGMEAPVHLEQASVDENVPALNAENLQEISWGEFSDSKSQN